MQSRIRLTFGEKSTLVWQEYQTFILVGKQILGGGKKNKVKPPDTVAAAKATWQNMFGTGSVI